MLDLQTNRTSVLHAEHAHARSFGRAGFKGDCGCNFERCLEATAAGTHIAARWSKVAGYGRYQKTNSKTDRTTSENTGPNQKTKIGKRKAEIKKRSQENQQTWRTISENMTDQISKQGDRKSETRTNERQKEPLQWRDGIAHARIPMLLETTLLKEAPLGTAAFLHFSVCGQHPRVKVPRPSITFRVLAETAG